jgi:hypothetical protein
MVDYPIGEWSFRNHETMGITLKFGDIIFIWDLSEDGKVQVGVEKCKDP